MAIVYIVFYYVPACVKYEELFLLFGGYLVEVPICIKEKYSSIATVIYSLYSLDWEFVNAIQGLQD
jgi:hypothetical protein